MSSRVRVLHVTHVLPDQDQAAAYSPLSDDDGIVRLSFMDALFVDRAKPMRRLFFYEGPTVPPFPRLVRSLQSSLAVALAVFPPLAGKLVYRASAGDVVVDCSPEAVAPGVRFVEAEYDGSVGDMRRVAAGDAGDADALKQLGPELDAGQLPAPVLVVQVTRPAAVGDERGVMVGVAIHHAVADGHSVWQFMRAWSAVSRAGSQTAPDLVPPVFDRAPILRYPGAEEFTREILRAVAPSLPAVVKSPSRSSNLPPDQRRRSFLLSVDEIQSLKRRILQAQVETTGEKLDAPPSTYVSVFSLTWASIVRAKSLAAGDAAYLLVAVDCRRRGTPVDNRYFGNCVVPCVARAAARDLCDDGARLAHAAAAIRAAIRTQQEDDEDPMTRGVERWLESWRVVPNETLTVTASSNRFMAYETDFGWGAPSRVELVSLFARELVMLLGAADGGVQVTVTLRPEHMEGFESSLLRLSGRRIAEEP